MGGVRKLGVLGRLGGVRSLREKGRLVDCGGCVECGSWV